MKSKLVDNQPQEVTNYLEIDPKEQDAVECVNEIFNTPLKGSYNWTILLSMTELKNFTN